MTLIVVGVGPIGENEGAQPGAKLRDSREIRAF
jgi:hypothetical protein